MEMVYHFPALNGQRSSAKWARVNEKENPRHVEEMGATVTQNKKQKQTLNKPAENTTTLKMAETLALNDSR